MNTKIELEEPYKSIYKVGYVITNSENRKHIILAKNDGGISSCSYARYLMAVKLGYFISKDFQVDHINNDKTDDRPENLQLLTQKENIAKQTKHYIDNIQKRYTLSCFNCNKEFIITERQLKMRNKSTKTGNFYCSRRCVQHTCRPPINSKRNFVYFPVDKIAKIKQLRSEGLSSYKIAEALGCARNTVMKYW